MPLNLDRRRRHPPFTNELQNTEDLTTAAELSPQSNHRRGLPCVEQRGWAGYVARRPIALYPCREARRSQGGSGSHFLGRELAFDQRNIELDATAASLSRIERIIGHG